MTPEQQRTFDSRQFEAELAAARAVAPLGRVTFPADFILRLVAEVDQLRAAVTLLQAHAQGQLTEADRERVRRLVGGR